MSFTLDKILEADIVFLGKLRLSRLYLMNNSNFPWLILIPERENVSEIIDLTEKDREQLFKEICDISAVVKNVCAPDKLNVANLGNVSPQLHVHVIARYREDPCWPDPVWGRGKPKQPYTPDAQGLIISKLMPDLKPLFTKA